MDHTTESKRIFSIDDIATFPTVGGAQFSPDGKSAVFVKSAVSVDDYEDQIMLMDLATGNQMALCAGSSPQWNAEGTAIAYIGDHEGRSAICKFDMGDHSRELVAETYYSDLFVDHYALANFSWSPDGKTIAYVSAGATDLQNSDRNSAVNEFTHVLYKSKGGRGRQLYADNAPTHIWLVNVINKESRPVFKSEYNEHSICWSPDGSKICFISNRTPEPGFSQSSDVFAVNIDSGEVIQLTKEKGSAFQPVWSPDGQYVAYLGIMSEISTNDSPAEDTQLYIVSVAGGNTKCLTHHLNRRIEQLSWDPSSAYVYFTAGNMGSTCLYRVALQSGEISTVIEVQGKVLEYSVAGNGEKIIYAYTSTVQPTDLFIHSVGGGETQVTRIGAILSGECLLQPAETFWYKSTDGLDVQGWLMKPVTFAKGTRYPLALVIHGGPHNMFGYEFEERMQLLCSNNYGVLFINPRGSSGYGQEFTNGCVRAWGEGDFDDLMRGVDVAIENNDWIDPLRLVVTGQSYGGYMTNRIISKTTRFRAAVADGSISNLVSFAGTSLYHSLMESEFRGSVYDNIDILWKCSPLRDVQKVSTPVLFLHGETDNEVPFSQAEEMFIAVKKQRVETKLVQFKGEGHGWRPDLLPLNRRILLKEMLEWFGRHT